MFLEHPFKNRSVPEFRFGESSEILHFIKKMLLQGYSFEICAREEVGQRCFFITMYSERDSYQLLFQFARINEPTFGTYIHAHQPVIALSVRSHVTEVLNETLDAGFPVFLLSEKDAGGKVSGHFTLLAHITDNS